VLGGALPGSLHAPLSGAFDCALPDSTRDPPKYCGEKAKTGLFNRPMLQLVLDAVQRRGRAGTCTRRASVRSRL